MNGRITLILMFCFFLSACGNKPAEKKTAAATVLPVHAKIIPLKQGLIEGIELHKVRRVPTIDMMARKGDTLIYCSEKGKIDLADTNGNSRKMIVDLQTEYLVNKLFLVPYGKKEWFLTWEETTMDGVRSYAAVYSSDAAKPEWKLFFRHPNPAKPVVDGDAAYISTLGMVAKVSLTNGTIIWQKDSLFNQSNFSYQQLEKAIVYPDQVIFVDYPVAGRRERRDSLFLDPVTGIRKK